MGSRLTLGLNAVIVAVTDEVPRVLTVSGRRSESGLPSGPFDPGRDRTLELALRGWVREQAGLDLGYVEQLYTFGNRFRTPEEAAGGPRLISIAYLALVREEHGAPPAGARWQEIYRHLPWEDWRGGRPESLAQIERALRAWGAAVAPAGERARRRERAAIAFGLEGAPWVGERVLERYELLYGSGLVAEAHRDRELARGNEETGVWEFDRDFELRLGQPMAADHRRILASALGRLRGKLRYRPVIFELLAPSFTLLQLQRVVEALAGVRLHKQNFRRLVEQGGLVEGTGRLDTHTGGRPAELFRFRREVLRERPAPGVSLSEPCAGTVL